MGKIGLFYGSTTGNTEGAAKEIAGTLGAQDVVDLYEVSSSSIDDINKYDNLIFGTSTWGLGDLQDDWESFLDVVGKADLAGKKVALFGLGDQAGYPDTFVDGIGILYEKVVEQKGTVVGFTKTDDYEFDGSRAIVNDTFVGLALDEDGQSEKSSERIVSWVGAIKGEFSL